LYDYYNTNDDNSTNTCGTGNYRSGQTFTVGAAGYIITSIKIKAKKTSVPGTLTVGTYATSSGHPTGSALTTGTTNANDFSTSLTWHEISVTQYTVAASTTYAIVLSTASCAGGGVGWAMDQTDPTYTGGSKQYIITGETWASNEAIDYMFEVWGNPLPVTITWALSGVSNDATGTIIAIDGTNYVYADFPKDFSWTIGSTKSVAATTAVPAGTGKQYAWSSWANGDGLSGASGTYTTPSSAITVTAVYATQWYLTVTSSYGSPTGQDWYTSDSSASSSVTSPVSGGTGIQYVCTGWTGTGSAPASGSSTNTGTFTMTQASSVTWSWVTQYQVTFTSSGIGADTSGTVVTVNGTAKTQAQLPYAVWYNDTHSASYAFSSPVAASAGKQYVWSSTSGLSQTLQSNIFAVTGTGTVTGTYGIQWQITITQSGIGDDTGATTIVVVNTVNKAAGDLPFAAWYNDGASIAYDYTSQIYGSSYQYGWVSTSGCSQTARSGSFSATTTCILTGNYGIIGGTVTLTTTVVSSVTTTTLATTITTSVNTQTTTETATYTSVTVAVTLTSITTLTNTFQPGGPGQILGMSLHVGTWYGVVNQTQIAIGSLPVSVTGLTGSFVVTRVEFGNAPWITLNETLDTQCNCYRTILPGEEAYLRFKVAPGADVKPNISYTVEVLVEGRVSSGFTLSSKSAAVSVTVYGPKGYVSPLAEIPQPSPALTEWAGIIGTVVVVASVGARVLAKKESGAIK